MKPDVFIIESLTFEDEQNQRFEGRILADILRLSGKNPIYFYVRTKRELRTVLEKFAESDYRYLHLSCHGNDESIATTLDDDIGFEELSEMLNPYLDRRRLFISSCDVVNDQLANVVMESGCLSIIGPSENVFFAEATVFWASFYYLAFLWDARGMASEDLDKIVSDLEMTFGTDVAYYGKTRRGYRLRSV
jgi:hypothetical protein